MSEWARRAHHYLNSTGRFKNFKKMSEGQRYEVIKEGLLEFIRGNPIGEGEVEEALEWFIANRKVHEARAFAKIMGLKVGRKR
ncbi:hypothetical protein D9Q81_08995 [Candidatus Korarchaeum cryptofilum]|jgi:hypothetical protein|uniref:Uncharacterized protein n=2 Tax=Candidatus Korarchaeum cryptofilum TaxID=498846 RepID=B1L3B3_KORCO|nr:hypothetical protein [Candidatus Korarchaeum cryptofilum]ACB06942.1 hypothetical protein Kcr_0182 [Candidatus Korarchaeum cryptofilum OPF8]MCC6029054.1 hypothetical protein [Candidatus Korarchaeum sp.]RSN67146.1 hypothetical protein D9Q81_08995 [Candidatus Korarchaeum cryptofilum]